MKHVKLLLCLLILFMAAIPVASATKPDRAIWWELESVRMDFGTNLSMAEMLSSMERPKTLTLRQKKFSLSGNDKGVFYDPFQVDNASVWIRNPDGVVSEAELSSGNGTFTLNLPSDLNPGELNGRYLVGVHLDAGVMDLDSDGTDERVHFYSKFLVNYRKQDGIKGENPDVFFKDDDKIALEIGPFFPETKSIFKKAGCPHADAIKGSKRSKVGFVRGGGNQTPLKEHKMKVFYKGQPLAGEEVVIILKTQSVSKI